MSEVVYPVEVVGSRLMLREFADEDVPAVVAIYGDPVATEHLSFEPRDPEQVTRTVLSAIRAAQDVPRVEFSLAVADRSTDAVIGFARLARDGTAAGQLGFALRPDHWGRGLGAETVELLLRLGFDSLRLHRIWGARSPVNDRSDRVMRRAGMIVEGRIRDHVFVRGRWRDSVVHSVLEHEWTASH